MLKRRGIKFYTRENEYFKASVVERFNTTLKTKMYRYFTYKNTRRYVDVLDDMLHSYNNTYHRSIGMTPAEVNVDNEHTEASVSDRAEITEVEVRGGRQSANRVAEKSV